MFISRGLIYDCEIIRRIPPKLGEIEPGYEYAKGWEDFQNLGVSVIATADYMSGAVNCFTADDARYNWKEFQRFVDLHGDGEIIGYNSSKYDDKLCAANRISVKTSFDLLEKIRIAAYGSPKYEDQPKGSNYSLANICQANGERKLGSGADSAKLWQDGKTEEVKKIALHDVTITRIMAIKFIEGNLIDPNTGRRLNLDEKI